MERFAIHRLEELPASCTSLRFIDPLLEHGQPFCGPGSVEFPRWYPEPMSLTSSSISDCSFMTAGSDSDSDSGGSARPPPVVAAAASPGERGNGHQHAGADVDDGHDCTDPNCPLHSGKRVIQVWPVKRGAGCPAPACFCSGANWGAPHSASGLCAALRP